MDHRPTPEPAKCIVFLNRFGANAPNAPSGTELALGLRSLFERCSFSSPWRNRMSRPQVLKRLVTVAVLVSLCSALFVSTNSPVRAATSAPATNLSSTKISPDLQQLILSGQGDQRVKVIVQSVPSATSGGLLGGLLNTVGGLLVSVLSAL